MKSQKFFRYLWRIDAVLILAATGIITLGVGSLLLEEFTGRAAGVRDARQGISVGAPESNMRLSLGRAVLVPGTNVMRADLVVNREGKGFNSSGGYAAITRRGIFFSLIPIRRKHIGCLPIMIILSTRVSTLPMSGIPVRGEPLQLWSW